jgi:hypothetical protein
VSDHDRTQRNEVIEMLRTWREATCTFKNGLVYKPSEMCSGDNHQMECAVERARQDMISALDKLDRLER